MGVGWCLPCGTWRRARDIVREVVGVVRLALSSRCSQLALWCRVWVSHPVLLCPVLCLLAGTPRDARRSEVPREVWQGLGQVLQHREVPHRAVRVLR